MVTEKSRLSWRVAYHYQPLVREGLLKNLAKVFMEEMENNVIFAASSDILNLEAMTWRPGMDIQYISLLLEIDDILGL